MFGEVHMESPVLLSQGSLKTARLCPFALSLQLSVHIYKISLSLPFYDLCCSSCLDDFYLLGHCIWHFQSLFLFLVQSKKNIIAIWNELLDTFMLQYMHTLLIGLFIHLKFFQSKWRLLIQFLITNENLTTMLLSTFISILLLHDINFMII